MNSIELVRLHHPLVSICQSRQYLDRENCSNLVVQFIAGRPGGLPPKGCQCSMPRAQHSSRKVHDMTGNFPVFRSARLCPCFVSHIPTTFCTRCFLRQVCRARLREGYVGSGFPAPSARQVNLQCKKQTSSMESYTSLTKIKFHRPRLSDPHAYSTRAKHHAIALTNSCPLEASQCDA